MKHPQHADRVVELTYGISMVVYIAIGIGGYLMYGRDVSDEVSAGNRIPVASGAGAEQQAAGGQGGHMYSALVWRERRVACARYRAACAILRKLRYIAHDFCAGGRLTLQISKDLAQTPGFSPLLNTIAVWMVALNPLTKIPLGLRPVSAASTWSTSFPP
jgi:hypothetical protein